MINVTVEADAFCGPGLAQKAAEAGVIYSMAYGDQPALASDLVDWARTCGFSVVAAGRGHKWLPHFRQSTPDTVWEHWGLTSEQAERGRLNPKMFNAFLDGSKPAIESAAIANATGLEAPENGLIFPPGGIDDIPTLMAEMSDEQQQELMEMPLCQRLEALDAQRQFQGTSGVRKDYCFGNVLHLLGILPELGGIPPQSGRHDGTLVCVKNVFRF